MAYNRFHYQAHLTIQGERSMNIYNPVDKDNKGQTEYAYDQNTLNKFSL